MGFTCNLFFYLYLSELFSFAQPKIINYHFKYILLMVSQKAKQILLQKLGRRIRGIRKSRNLSQQAMAEKCEMDYGSYSNIENGKRNITIFTLQRIIRLLKISFNELFNFLNFVSNICTKITPTLQSGYKELPLDK